MKKNALTLLFALCSAIGFSQEFEVPASFDPKVPESEFAKYQPDFFNALDWLINTPPDNQPEKHRQVNAFVVGWVSGTPDVTLEINGGILNFMEDHEQYLPIFMAGWAKYALTAKDSDAVKGNVAGIESTLQFYEKHKSVLGKSEGLEAYAKAKKKGNLENYVRKKLKA